MLLLSAAMASPSLVLISMDTTRADALGSDGSVFPGLPPGAQATPTLDALAADGLRFARAYAHAPSTLTSHATLFTGLDPHGHGVVRNGYPLQGQRTLAERLGDAGYETIGIVAAKALSRRMGVARGFRVYDDTTPELHGLMYQRPADAVVDAALAAVDARQPGPLFLFVHLYDPHAPYAAPDGYAPPFRPVDMPELVAAHAEGTADPEDIAYVARSYLAEVTFADAQIARLLAGLRARGVLDEALVVVTADHGETMSEDVANAWSHGADVTEGSMRVPLIVKGYGVPVQTGVVERTAMLSELPSTLEVALGLPPTLGRDMWDLWRAGPVLDTDGWPERPTRTVHLEATRPRSLESTTSWNNLPLPRGLHAGGWSATAFPARDGAWTLLGSEDVTVLPWLRLLAHEWDAAAPRFRPQPEDPVTDAQLRALGYTD